MRVCRHRALVFLVSSTGFIVMLLAVTETAWWMSVVGTWDHHLNSKLNLDLNNETTKSTKPLKWHYINMVEDGGLGNVMFEFASMVGTANHMGYTPVISRNNILCRVFEDIPYISDKTLENVQKFKESYAAVYDRKIDSLTKTSNWTLVGFYQSWRYFRKVSLLVKKCFNFKTDILNRARDVLKRLRLNNETVIGVHVRRGDMTKKHFIDFGYCTAPANYLIGAMNYFRKKYDNIIFVVVSNDRNWCTKNINNSDVRIPDDNGPYVDLALLSMCNHTIITSGTFGWWGAWLGGGDTIYFSGFPTPGSTLDGITNRTDYYPPNWIPMS